MPDPQQPKPITCIRCGGCCKASPCSVAAYNYWVDEEHWKKHGCPMYFEKDGVACCKLIGNPLEDAQPVEYYIDALLIGKGCKNPEFRRKEALWNKWFHNIVHLTIDSEGEVRWKGVVVETYAMPWAYSNDAILEALELGYRCRHLESIGVVVSNKNVIWDWGKYKDRTVCGQECKEDPYVVGVVDCKDKSCPKKEEGD